MNRYFCLKAFCAALILTTHLYAQFDGVDRDVRDASSQLKPTRLLKDSSKEDEEDSERRTKGPTEITATEAAFDQKTNQGVFTTNVIVKDPEFDLTCDKLTVFLKSSVAKSNQEEDAADNSPATTGADPQQKSESGLDRAIAEGNVIIVQEKPDTEGKMTKYTAKGTKAVYETATGNLTLYGSPEVIQTLGGALAKKITAIEEECIIILNREGKIDTRNGRATTTIMDASSLETPKKN